MEAAHNWGLHMKSRDTIRIPKSNRTVMVGRDGLSADGHGAALRNGVPCCRILGDMIRVCDVRRNGVRYPVATFTTRAANRNVGDGSMLGFLRATRPAEKPQARAYGSFYELCWVNGDEAIRAAICGTAADVSRTIRPQWACAGPADDADAFRLRMCFHTERTMHVLQPHLATD
ncbi:hypothetical protein BD309DRAFT_563012 [Dichomitus squalens]|nr:hypothetical protein BD309DRAFT_563012 [Dichomitus squalens]